jgi:uncharacterized protein (DUF58 family)
LVWLIVLLVALTGLTVWSTRAWSSRALQRLTYERFLSAERCFAGDELELKLQLTNDKWLPVGFVRANDQVPKGLSIAGRKVDYLRSDRSLWRQIWSINWYQRVIRRYKVKALKRGFYHLGPVTLGAGDPFGLRLRYREDTAQTAVVVYPRLRELVYAGLPPGHPFGTQKSRDPLLADPMRMAGVREYQAGDPLNRIHWKATAATGNLQVRVLEPTAQQVVAVFVNAWSFDRGWQGTDVEATELAVDTAAAVIHRALQDGRQVALYANGSAEGWGGRIRLPASRTPDTLTNCLEGLARLSIQGKETLAEVVAAEAAHLPYGAVVIVITRQLSADLTAILLDLQQRGRKVRVIYTARCDETTPAKLTCWQARDGDTLVGEDGDAIYLEAVR